VHIKLKMKQILITIMLTLTLAAYGQEQPKVVEKYEQHTRAGNFLNRWYFDLIGTSTIWKEGLTLYDDQTYRYVYKGGESGTFDRDEVGSWEKKDSILLLNGERHYLIMDDKLYFPGKPINQEAWVMKKVN